MKAIATAHKNRSLNEFETALAFYNDGIDHKFFYINIQES